VDLEPAGVDLLSFEEESRVSDIELARGDIHASRSSILSKRMSGYSLGSRFEEDELPAFGEHDLGIEAPKISFGGESGIGADPRDNEMGGGFDAFDNVLDESSQRTSEVSAIAAVREERKSIDEEESKQRVARDRASFRLSLLMGEGEDDEGLLASPLLIFLYLYFAAEKLSPVKARPKKRLREVRLPPLFSSDALLVANR
jgi:hypothetical protein